MAFSIWDKSVEKLLDDFETFTEKLDDDLQKRIYEVIAKLDSKDGKLTPQNLSNVFKEIDDLFSEELARHGYKFQFEKIQDLANVIAIANVGIHANINKLTITQKELFDAGNLKLFKENVINSLGRAGMVDNVVIPMKMMINSAVNTGKGVGALITEFRDLFSTGSTSIFTTIKGKSLKSYARQVANDTTNAVNGTIQTYIRDKYDVKGIRYIGNTIKDSRPFCVHMIKDEKYPMDYKRLEVILKEYVGSQVPVVVGKNKNGTDKKVKKGAGMYPQTNKENFLSVVGGYNCRHRAFAVRL